MTDLTISPQGPRRPRFSFFSSSHCQRTDPVILADADVVIAFLTKTIEQNFLAGDPAANPARFVIVAGGSEPVWPAASALGGYRFGPLDCQHPKIIKVTLFFGAAFLPWRPLLHTDYNKARSACHMGAVLPVLPAKSAPPCSKFRRNPCPLPLGGVRRGGRRSHYI